jgi:hypothetical protein
MSNSEAQLQEFPFVLDEKGGCFIVSFLDKTFADVVAEAVGFTKIHCFDGGDLVLWIFVYRYEWA